MNRLRGNGKITENGQPVAPAQYDIEKVQEYLVTEAFDGSSEIEGLAEYRGRILPPRDVHMFGRDNLRLHIEDGQSVSFFVTSSGRMPWYTVTFSGPLA